MRNEILEYEKRLLEDREQLRKLVESIGESTGESADIEQDKLNFFRAELAYMNKQLELLSQGKGAATVTQKTNVQPVSPHPAPQQYQPSQSVPQSVQYQQTVTQQQMIPPYQQYNQMQTRMPYAAPMSYVQQVPYVPQVPLMQPLPQAPQRKPEDFEKKFGKTFMGIVASVLIFISIILFATLLIPSLNDTIKMVVTYVVSFIICGIGCIKLHKNRQDKFYLALTGCGMGALYISLLLSNMYFKMLPDIPLYALIAVWAVGICVLSRYNNLVFQIIGQIGIVISVIFGVALCISTEDVGKFTVLVIFYIVTSIVLYATHFKRRFDDNVCAHIANVISLFVIYMGSMFVVDRGHIVFIILLLFVLAHIAVCYICTWKANECASGFIISFYGLFFCFSMFGLIENDTVCAVIIYTFMMILGAVAQFRKEDKDSSRIVVQVFAITSAFIAVCCVEMLMLHCLVPMLIVPLLLIGFWKENNLCKIDALLIAYHYITFARDIHAMEWFVVGVLLVGTLYTLVYVCKDQYNSTYKGFVHVLGVLLFAFVGMEVLELFISSRDVCYSVNFIVVALFNVAIMKSPFSRDVRTGAKEKEDLYNAINALMMFMGLTSINADLPMALHIIVVLVTLGIFMVNSKNLLDKHPTGFGGAYVGIKFTIFMLVLLASYEATNYVVSIACFLFAVASIALGFALKYKSLRVYGLVLCMISVFKLIVMDIEYADTLGYAISFFVAGVLCFAISLLYNFVDKRMNNMMR